MTNSEILIKEFGNAELVEALPELVMSSLMDAAREDEAVGFAEWVADNNRHKYRAGWGDMTGKDSRYYTTKELY